MSISYSVEMEELHEHAWCYKKAVGEQSNLHLQNHTDSIRNIKIALKKTVCQNIQV